MLSRVLPILALLAATAFAAEWPQWRGPARTGHVPAGEPVPDTLPAEPKIIWRTPIGEGFASPIVSGGRVFYLDSQDAEEVARAADAATGRELWSAKLFSAHKDGFGTGPRCTPVADGDRVYFQSAKGELRCLAAADGKLIWRTNFVEDFGAIYIGEKGKAAGASRHGATGSPIVEGDHLIAQVGGLDGASLVAFQKKTGEVVWKSGNDQTAYAAPFIATVAGVRQVFSFNADALAGFGVDGGRELWRVPFKTAFGRHVTTPIVWRDLVVIASHQVGLVATRLKPAGTGVAASEAWTNAAMKINFSSPVATGDHLYGLGPAKNLVCIDLATGQLAWEQPGATQTSADKAEAAFLVMGKNILTLTDTGELILFAADPAAYRERARTQVCGANWTNPAYAAGRLYLRDARELLCVELLPHPLTWR